MTRPDSTPENSLSGCLLVIVIILLAITVTVLFNS